MNEEEEALISWFISKQWPATYHKISAWESTDNLARTITTTIEAARQGNANSVEVLKRLKTSLDKQPAGINAS
ncbi:hypothetical protein [Spirosoma jeollabukense]